MGDRRLTVLMIRIIAGLYLVYLGGKIIYDLIGSGGLTPVYLVGGVFFVVAGLAFVVIFGRQYYRIWKGGDEQEINNPEVEITEEAEDFDDEEEPKDSYVEDENEPKDS